MILLSYAYLHMHAIHLPPPFEPLDPPFEPLDPPFEPPEGAFERPPPLGFPVVLGQPPPFPCPRPLGIFSGVSQDS